jgi:hypothetical protein
MCSPEILSSIGVPALQRASPDRRKDKNPPCPLCLVVNRNRIYDRPHLVVLFRNIRMNSFLTAETRSSQRRWYFFSGGERPPEKNPSRPLRCKGFMQISAGDREAAFYPTASHGRKKENPNPLRPLRLCGEYVSVFMKRCT